MDNLKKEAREVKGRMVGYIGAALGLVAGLAWNEAITSFINSVFTLDKNSVFAKFVYAAILTAVVVILIQRLERLSSKENGE